NRGNVRVDQSLLAYLNANTQDIFYLMAVPSSMQGADYVLATDRPVLYMGGFNGRDPVVTSDDLAQMVSAGELRYIYLSGGGGTNAEVSSWVASSCTLVEGFDSVTRNAGAPDGTPGSNFTPGQSGDGQSINLYDCG
ncbi:MAG: hypothetical protein JW862_00035, partial [Anaerolineales bacterium]|nr:hypothetical protein [Anaerolineales bacterium]